MRGTADDAAGGGKTHSSLVEDPVCCREANLLSCVAADITPTSLGRGSLALPPNIVLQYVGHVGADKRSFYYRGGGGGAYAVITCRSGGGRSGHCNGQAKDATGGSFVLEYCGRQGHVWKQPDMGAFSDNEIWQVRVRMSSYVYDFLEQKYVYFIVHYQKMYTLQYEYKLLSMRIEQLRWQLKQTAMRIEAY